jgi:hypothetical protein
MKTGNRLILLGVLLFGLSVSAAAGDAWGDPLETGISGTWTTQEQTGRSCTLKFEDGHFSLQMKVDDTEISEEGLYAQETNKIFLIVTNGNIQTQKEMEYEMINSNTIEVKIDGKRFMLERQDS